jgi:hypothetical protein
LGETTGNVMITIFCDIRHFSAKKLAFFSKTNFMIKFLHNLALFGAQKRQFFADFLRKCLKNHIGRNIANWAMVYIGRCF